MVDIDPECILLIPYCIGSFGKWRKIRRWCSTCITVDVEEVIVVDIKDN